MLFLSHTRCIMTTHLQHTWNIPSLLHKVSQLYSIQRISYTFYNHQYLFLGELMRCWKHIVWPVRTTERQAASVIMCPGVLKVSHNLPCFLRRLSAAADFLLRRLPAAESGLRRRVSFLLSQAALDVNMWTWCGRESMTHQRPICSFFCWYATFSNSVTALT